MRYTKPHLSLEQQVELLLQKGLIADRSELWERLRDIGYYRLSAYTHPFKQRNKQGVILSSFSPGTTLDNIITHYRFDRQLRLLLLDSIERIEVALRSILVNLHTAHHGAFEYAASSYFPRWDGYMQQIEKARIRRDKNKRIIYRGEEYIDHFFSKYGDYHDYLPLWMAVGNFEMGTIVYFFIHSTEQIRQKIADHWQTDRNALTSWLQALRGLRNICAHHGRVWNRHFMFPPKIPAYSVDKRWHLVYSEKAHKWVKPTSSLQGAPSMANSANHVGALLFICRQLMHSIAPHSRWHERAEQLITSAAANGINIHKMALPQHWQRHPLWTL